MRMPEGPRRTQERRADEDRLLSRAWLANQRLVGRVGVWMPLVIIIGDALLFPDDAVRFPRQSLSAYFYSGMSGVFVGSLCIMGAFLVTYQVCHWNWENLVSAAAGIFAVGVALFPTGPDPAGTRASLTALQNRFGAGQVADIHVVCAFGFIGSLFVMSLLFAREEHLHDDRTGVIRHLAWASAMLVAASGGAAATLAGYRSVHDLSVLLIVEVVCALSFGASWKAMGKEISARNGIDLPRQREPLPERGFAADDNERVARS